MHLSVTRDGDLPLPMPSPGLTLDVVGGLLLICNHIVCFVRLPASAPRLLSAAAPLLSFHSAHAMPAHAAPAGSFVSDSAATIALGFAPFHSSARHIAPLAASAAMCINFCIAAAAEAAAAASQDAITMGPRHFPVCQLVINGSSARPVSPVRHRRCRLILRNLRLLKRGQQQQQQQPQQPAATDFVAS